MLEDQYYSALRKNLEISAACQAVEEDMQVLQARIDRLTPKQQQQQPPSQHQEGGGGAAAAASSGDEQQPHAAAADGPQEAQHAAQEQPLQNGVTAETETAMET